MKRKREREKNENLSKESIANEIKKKKKNKKSKKKSTEKDNSETFKNDSDIDEEDFQFMSGNINDQDVKVKKEDTYTWPIKDLTTLIERMKLNVPGNDKLRFTSQLKRLKWENVAFKSYSPEQCRQMWEYVQKHVRCYRILMEILIDAESWVKQPWINFRSQKPKTHPDMPRRPLSSYMIFFKEQKTQVLKDNPKMEMPNLTKHIAEIYNNLPPKVKEKYTQLASKQREQYVQKLNQFYETHPELAPTKPLKQKAAANVPKRPFRLFYEHKLEKAGSVDKIMFIEKCKRKWKKLSDKKKLLWINQALAQTSIFDSKSKESEVYKQKLENLLTKEERALKDKSSGKPTKPPTSAYGLFSRRMLQSEEIKSTPPKERMTLIAQLWKKCTAEEKLAYKDEFNKLVSEYMDNFITYLNSLSEEERARELLNQQLKNRAIKSTLQSKKKKPSTIGDIASTQSNSVRKSSSESDDSDGSTVFTLNTEKTLYPGEPTLPPSSAFNLFAMEILEKRPIITKGKIKILWNQLSREEKQVYRRKLTDIEKKYIIKYEQFLKSLTPEQLKEYSQLNSVSVLDPESTQEDDSEETETDGE